MVFNATFNNISLKKISMTCTSNIKCMPYVLQDKDKRHGDDSHSIGSASDSGRGNSDDENSRSPHSSGTFNNFLILES